jgi:hypothetical protein
MACHGRCVGTACGDALWRCADTPREHSQNRQIRGRLFAWATEQDPLEKEAKTDAELEDMILQRLVIGGVFVSVRRDPLLGWRPTVVTAPKHTRNAQELADKIAAELRKKFVLRD